MAAPQKKQDADQRYLSLDEKLAKGIPLHTAAIQSKLTIKQAIDHLQSKKQYRDLEPELLSEISHRSLMIGLQSLVDLAETCMIPQIRAQSATALVGFGIKLREMSLAYGAQIIPTNDQPKLTSQPWKFDNV